MVEKVETWIDNPVTGDTLLVALYSEYKDFGGLKFPTRIIRKQGDGPVLDLTVTDVKVCIPVNVTAPPAGAGGGQPPVTTSRPTGRRCLSDPRRGYASIFVELPQLHRHPTEAATVKRTRPASLRKPKG